MATAGLITTVYACEPVAPTVSVAVMVKLNVPLALGAPDSVPAAVKVRPVGTVPTVTENVESPVPPVAATVWL